MSTPYPPNYQLVEPAYSSTPQETDKVSVAGLVLALLFWPAGLALSIVGITRTSEGQRRGRGLAIAGIVVSSLGALFFLILVAVIAGSEVGEDTDSTPRTTEVGEADDSAEVDSTAVKDDAAAAAASEAAAAAAVAAAYGVLSPRRSSVSFRPL